MEALSAHRSKCVNAVAWHPRDPSVFASVGDDHRLRMYVADTILIIKLITNNVFSDGLKLRKLIILLMQH